MRASAIAGRVWRFERCAAAELSIPGIHREAHRNSGHHGAAPASGAPPCCRPFPPAPLFCFRRPLFPPYVLHFARPRGRRGRGERRGRACDRRSSSPGKTTTAAAAATRGSSHTCRGRPGQAARPPGPAPAEQPEQALGGGRARPAAWPAAWPPRTKRRRTAHLSGVASAASAEPWPAWPPWPPPWCAEGLNRSAAAALWRRC